MGFYNARCEQNVLIVVLRFVLIGIAINTYRGCD